MFRATLVVTSFIYVAFVLALIRECIFLRPLIALIWRDYELAAMLFSALFVFNSAAVVFPLLRWLMLADTGAKLAQIEKGLRGRLTISQELTDRLREDR